MGVPTGPHGAFRDYQVDAITVEILPKVFTLGNKVRQDDFLLRSGRLVLSHSSFGMTICIFLFNSRLLSKNIDMY